TTHLEVAAERVGFGALGRAGRSGLPPRVTDICPGDVSAQATRRVTIDIAEPEAGDELLDQVSFLLGGMTTVIGGQAVFRQIYALRDATGVVTVAPEPASFVFDPTDTVNLRTPPGLES